MIERDEDTKLWEELRTRSPRTASELNMWLRMHFQVFEAPPRAYFELAIDAARVERRAHVVASWVGPESDCVERAVECFASLYTDKDAFVDASEPLFIRRWASYRDTQWELDDNKKWIAVPGALGIRFSLWDLSMMSHIGAIFPIRNEGMP